mgnify:CR=1 FL=1
MKLIKDIIFFVGLGSIAATGGYFSTMGLYAYNEYQEKQQIKKAQEQIETKKKFDEYIRKKYYSDVDCSDFSSHSEAQDYFEENGNYDNLDGDGDGLACESL